MIKPQIDQLYHLLRCAFNEGEKRQSSEVTNAIYGLAGHLLAGRDYLRLIQYSRYYGERFLLQPTHRAIVEHGWLPDRIVELGAGLGWLSRGLVSMLRAAEVLTVDKRPWMAIDIMADLETDGGLARVLAQMKDKDLVVMSDFLHCVEKPETILSAFSKYPMVIIEYMPTNVEWATSYTLQIERYGGNPIDAIRWLALLSATGRKVDMKDLDPYALILIDGEE